MGLFSFLNIRKLVKEHPLLTKETKEFHNQTKTILSRLRKVRCINPQCSGFFHENANNEIVCSDCGLHFSEKSRLKDYFYQSQDADKLVRSQRSFARIMIISAEILLAVSSIWAFFSQNFSTLLGGFFLSCLFFLYAFAASYRAWQIENNRLFERSAPLKDYIKSLYH